MNPKKFQPAEDRDHEAHVAAKLANFGDSAGHHGALAAVTVKLSPRVSRDTNLRLVNLSRAVGLKPSAVQVLALDTMSRVPAVEFFATIAELQKRAV